MLEAVGYARTSTPGQSVDRQKAEIEQVALQRGLTLVDVLEDVGVSGTIPLGRRPAGKQLVDHLARIPIICTSHCDRLWRNLRDAEVCLEAWQGRDIRLHLADPPAEWAVRSVDDRMLIRMAVVAALHEIELKAECQRSKLAELKSLERYTGGGVPFGYHLKDGRLIPNPGEQRTRRRARELQDAGLSPGEIRKLLETDRAVLHPQKLSRMLNSEDRHGRQ